jgi:hypothetical protein
MNIDSNLIWGAALILLGLGAFYGFKKMLDEQKAAQNWPTAIGTVLVSRLETSSSDGSTMYEPYVQYRYTVLGKQYTHNKYTLIQSSSNLKGHEEKKLVGFAVGASVPVYYNPSDPANAVLVAKTSKTVLGLILVAGVALVIGGVAIAL